MSISREELRRLVSYAMEENACTPSEAWVELLTEASEQVGIEGLLRALELAEQDLIDRAVDDMLGT